MANELSYNQEVGARLRRIREKLLLGQPQNELAYRLGADPRRYNNWEKGVVLFPIEFAARLCGMANVDLDYIYRGELSDLPVKVITLLEDAARADSPPPSPRRGS